MIYDLLFDTIENDDGVVLSSAFLDLSKEVCMNQILLDMSPFTVLAGILLLGGKLRATMINRRRLFQEIMLKIAYEYEVSITDLLRSYINQRTLRGASTGH